MSKEDDTKKWVPIPRISRVVPFGYEVSEEDKSILVPVEWELKCLEEAKKHLRKGYSLRAVSEWLSEASGRYLSHQGLKKRIEGERRRTRQVAGFQGWAKRVKESEAKAKKLQETRLGSYKE